MRHRLNVRLAIIATLTGSLLGMALATTYPAQAWTLSNCQQGAGSAGYLCYYFSANYDNAREGVADAVSDFSGTGIEYQFTNNGSGGLGDPVYKDAHSAVNRRTDCTARIYSGASYTGAFIAFSPCCQVGQNPPYQEGDLGVLDNANVSQQFCG
jgi:hypothetical protein